MAQQPKEFEIQIDPSGKVQVHTKGAKGEACHDWADIFVQLLGREVSRSLTGEFYESSNEQARRQVDVKNRVR
ncbi:MAG TPA: DUF2997 domain-containing protein [Tepidisphaeraceae bacterium]|jgi:hypothetical protein